MTDPHSCMSASAVRLAMRKLDPDDGITGGVKVLDPGTLEELVPLFWP